MAGHPMAGRQVVLVSGVPGTGKSTVAGPLAAQLGFALLGKDRIKETLADALGPDVPGADGAGAGELIAGEFSAGEFSAAASRRLGGAAMEVLWALAADAPAVVLDANFWVDDERQLRRIRALSGRPVEVYCVCLPELAAQRYQARGAGRHSVHAAVGASLTPETIARSGRPVGLGPVITVDTGCPVDVVALAGAVHALLAG